MQADSQLADAFSAQRIAQHGYGRALLAAAASGELFDLVESKDSGKTASPQQPVTAGSPALNRAQVKAGAQQSMKQLQDHRQRFNEVRRPCSNCLLQSPPCDHAFRP